MSSYVQDPVSERPAVLVKRYNISQQKELELQLSVQQVALQRCDTQHAHVWLMTCLCSHALLRVTPRTIPYILQACVASLTLTNLLAGSQMQAAQTLCRHCCVGVGLVLNALQGQTKLCCCANKVHCARLCCCVPSLVSLDLLHAKTGVKAGHVAPVSPHGAQSCRTCCCVSKGERA